MMRVMVTRSSPCESLAPRLKRRTPTCRSTTCCDIVEVVEGQLRDLEPKARLRRSDGNSADRILVLSSAMCFPRAICVTAQLILAHPASLEEMTQVHGQMGPDCALPEMSEIELLIRFSLWIDDQAGLAGLAPVPEALGSRTAQLERHVEKREPRMDIQLSPREIVDRHRHSSMILRIVSIRIRLLSSISFAQRARNPQCIVAKTTQRRNGS